MQIIRIHTDCAYIRIQYTFVLYDAMMSYNMVGTSLSFNDYNKKILFSTDNIYTHTAIIPIYTRVYIGCCEI